MDKAALEFFRDFRQNLLVAADANQNFQLSEFLEVVTKELIDTGFIEGFEFCHYRPPRGTQVDGYWFDDEGSLALFIADFNCRDELLSLTKTEVVATFRRLTNFFETTLKNDLYRDMEETSPEYGLARSIRDKRAQLRRVNFFLISERILSDRIQSLEDGLWTASIQRFMSGMFHGFNDSKSRKDTRRSWTSTFLN